MLPTLVALLASLAAPAAAGRAPSLPAAEVAARAQALYPELGALYRHLHAHPELSFQETATAALLAERLRGLGFEVTTGVGKTGLVGVLRNGPGPTLLLRSDMDVLPVAEATGLPYASSATGRGPDGSPVPACGRPRIAPQSRALICLAPRSGFRSEQTTFHVSRPTEFLSWTVRQ